MSTSRGSSTRKRPQKHQNRTAFKNDLHDTSHKTKFLNTLDVQGVCKRCKDIIDWKIKYKKYKALTAPRKCVGCEQKSVKHAYHMLCSNCAKAKTVCAKCCKPVKEDDVEETDENIDILTMLKGLPERKRRTIQRYLNRQEDEQKKVTPDLLSKIEEMLSKIDKISLFDDDDDDLENFLNEEGFGDSDIDSKE